MIPARHLGEVANLSHLREAALALIRDHGGDQIGLTHPPGAAEGEKARAACGSLHGTGRREADFSAWMAGTEAFRAALEAVSEGPLGRVRLMRAAPRRCYSVHRDYTARVHIPLWTNDQALMIWPGIPFVLHMPDDGGAWLTDTTLPHTAMNGGTQDRWHVVAALSEDG